MVRGQMYDKFCFDHDVDEFIFFQLNHLCSSYMYLTMTSVDFGFGGQPCYLLIYPIHTFAFLLLRVVKLVILYLLNCNKLNIQ